MCKRLKILIVLFINILNVNLFAQNNGLLFFTQKCVSCHNPNGSAPFNLLTYEDIASKRSMIQYVINENIMPQWRPDTSFSKFKNCRALNKNEKLEILNWVKNFRKGDELPKINTNELLSINKDIIQLEYPIKIKVPSNPKDTTIVFEYPYSIEDAIGISQIVFYCSDMKLLHHVNFFISDSLKLKTMNFEEAMLLKENYMKFFDIAFGYAPGNKQQPFDNGFGYMLPKAGLIKGDLHLSPNNKEREIIFGVKLVKSKVPIIHKLFLHSPAKLDDAEPLVLEPNKEKYFKQYYTTTADIYIKYCHPHMHVFGKSFLSYAITPSNDTINLVKIDKWNFYQQEFYEFEQPVFIPKNSKIYYEAWYDNTSKNPYNPFLPPIFITSGVSTNQEMLLNYLICFDK